MKRSHFVLAATAGAALSVLVYLLWTLHGSSADFSVEQEHPEVPSRRSLVSGPLTLEARLSNANILQGSDGRLHLGLTLYAADDGARKRAPLDLVLLIDRSGSMSGDRIEHAKTSALLLLDQLHDGDRFALVTYNTSASVEVPSTLIANNRASIRDAIQRMSAGGNTCISCGLEAARGELALSETQRAHRILLLSDGIANRGLQEPGSLGAKAREIERLGATVTTVGVGLGYNEHLMSQLAIEGNGNHYFVQNAATLASTLQNELNTLKSLVATQAHITLTLPEGVRFIRGYDRHFQVDGQHMTISLGALSAGSRVTVLAELAAPTQISGEHTVVHLELQSTDAASSTVRTDRAELRALITDDARAVANSADDDVSARVEQARVAHALAEANSKLARGQVEEARAILKVEIDSAKQNPLAWSHQGYMGTVDALTGFEAELEGLQGADDANLAAKKGEVFRRDLAR